MRIAIISSPRCGAHFRDCLSKLLNLKLTPFISQKIFQKISRKFIFQLHWEMDENLKIFYIMKILKITLIRNHLIFLYQF